MKYRDLLNLTFNDAEYAAQSGRITAREWRRYLFAWAWSAGRFSSLADRTMPTPDRYFRRFGQPRYFARRAQVERIVAAMRAAPVPFVDVATIDDGDGCGPRRLSAVVRCF